MYVEIAEVQYLSEQGPCVVVNHDSEVRWFHVAALHNADNDDLPVTALLQSSAGSGAVSLVCENSNTTKTEGSCTQDVH